ncbi:MAG: glycosyltransferase family 4 protein, partial [Caldilineaceae bacterium]|nr:glycosyltransferase family 4 protein [Caldilineaceae bacterium]
MKPISVTLDAGPAVHQQAGLSRYTTRLAENLLHHAPEEIDLTLLFNRHSGHTLPATLQTAPTRTVDQGQYGWRIQALTSQWLHRPRAALLPPPDTVQGRQLYHATEHLLPRVACPTVLTVHDLIFERYPEHHKLTNRLFLAVGMRLFVRHADTIIAVSQQTKRDLIELYQTPAAKIHVIYQGIDPTFAPAVLDDIQRIRHTYARRATDGTPRPYLLMLGTLEPRKNHLTAMKALARLKAAGFPHALLIAGGEGWLFEPVRQQVAALGLENDVHFTGYVPAADLAPLYGGATCVLQPSLYEGFGFPVLEAMACGVPVICSNTSSLPEAAGNAALLVDPLDD